MQEREDAVRKQEHEAIARIVNVPDVVIGDVMPEPPNDLADMNVYQ